MFDDLLSEVPALRAAGQRFATAVGLRVRASAGAWISAPRHREEITSSVISEVVPARRGGTGRPLLGAGPLESIAGDLDLEKLERVVSAFAPVTGESGDSQ